MAPCDMAYLRSHLALDGDCTITIEDVLTWERLDTTQQWMVLHDNLGQSQGRHTLANTVSCAFGRWYARLLYSEPVIVDDEVDVPLGFLVADGEGDEDDE